jgi:hypothetical protein
MPPADIGLDCSSCFRRLKIGGAKHVAWFVDINGDGPVENLLENSQA